MSLAGPLEEGVTAHQRGDYSTALAVFRSLATRDDAAAQYNLGQMHRLGQGVLRDATEAAKWYRLAAAQGDGQSQYNLGVMYYSGQGVPQSLVYSHMWLSLSAMSGVENAVRNRAMLAKRLSQDQLTESLQLVRTCQQQSFKQCD